MIIAFVLLFSDKFARFCKFYVIFCNVLAGLHDVVFCTRLADRRGEGQGKKAERKRMERCVSAYVSEGLISPFLL